jgi:DeoR/GlpR family transcriptional regulator of sugar metabolism
MIGRARTVQLVADARKFGERGLNVIVTADAVDEAYLADPPAAAQKLFAAAGADVHVV